MAQRVDTLIIGAGAAGLFCGARAGARGHSVLVVDHARKPAEKVRISGGGRCNFTNIHTAPEAFLSANPHFAKSALARYSPYDFCDLMARYDLTWHEKTLGQLFCDQKSGAIIQMLLDELTAVRGELRLQTEVTEVSQNGDTFSVQTSDGEINASRLVIATGGLSIPKMGASSFAYDIARQFRHTVIEPRPALVPLTFTGAIHDAFTAISGVSTPVSVAAETGPAFAESLLFTHRGLSGPSILQASSYWQQKEEIEIDLLPGTSALEHLQDLKTTAPRQTLSGALSDLFPKRLAEMLAAQLSPTPERRLAEFSGKDLQAIAATLNAWRIRPAGTEGWRTAEVTAGGIDTKDLSSRTLESKIVPRLFFIGECVDVTGWLGGYNFQWAWASAAAAVEAV